MKKKLATMEPNVSQGKKRQRQVSMTEYGFRQTVYDLPIRPLKRKRSVQMTLDALPRAMTSVSLAIVGSREYCDHQKGMAVIKNFVDWLARECNMLVERVVSGGARGSDRIAEFYAEEVDLPIQVYEPDMQIPSPARYHQRNQLIVDDSDVVLAFWDEKTHGTKDTLKRAQRKELPMYVYNFRRPDVAWSKYKLARNKRPKKTQ